MGTMTTARTDPPPTTFSHHARFFLGQNHADSREYHPPRSHHSPDGTGRRTSAAPERRVVMSRHDAPTDFRPEDLPIAWCAQILLESERGDFEAAANAQRELRRLGWQLNRVQYHQVGRQAARRKEGVAT